MNARFAPALVAFAAATALASRPHVLAEFLVQLRDPNLLGGTLFAALLKTFGFAFVLALCAVLAGSAVLLAGWRTRTRGVPDGYAALAASLAVLCMLPRFGISLDPIGWLCAAAFAFLVERRGRYSRAGAIAVAGIWALLQGGAPLAALLAILAFLGAFIDARAFDAAVRGKAVFAAIVALVSVFQLHALPWRAYGPHVLYLDAFAAGAQRDPLWTTHFTLPAASFCALIVFAAWFGVRRRGKSTDALWFFALMLLAMADARNLPYFGILAAPIIADAAASYYLQRRTLPRGSIRNYAVTYAAAALAFIAVIAASEPKALWWPQTDEQPASLLVALANDKHEHTLLCQQPRWCDGTQLVFPAIHPLVDDRGGIIPAPARRTEYDAVATHGAWRIELRRSGVDAVIARNDANLVALLVAGGWRVTKQQDDRVLLRPGGVR
jgi:hypothetical protein